MAPDPSLYKVRGVAAIEALLSGQTETTLSVRGKDRFVVIHDAVYWVTVRLLEGVKKVQVRAQGMDHIISPVGHSWDG